MYVIATVFCSNFHFSVSLHVPFSQFLFERDSYSNEYLLAKFGFDTAKNEPCEVRKFELSEMLNLNFEISELLFFATQETIQRALSPAGKAARPSSEWLFW